MNDNAVVGTPRRGTGATVIAALGGLLFGYDTGIISAALLYLGPAFGLSDQAKEIVVASLLVGAIVGVAGGGTVMDRIGRRRTLLGVAVLFLAGAVASGLAGSLTVLLLARIVLGLAIGAASVAVPAYIAEIAPAHLRGRLVSVNQLMISSGILLSYVTGYVLSDAQAWRWMLAIAAVPAAVMLVALPRLPESPRWLLAKGRETRRGPCSPTAAARPRSTTRSAASPRRCTPRPGPPSATCSAPGSGRASSSASAWPRRTSWSASTPSPTTPRPCSPAPVSGSRPRSCRRSGSVSRTSPSPSSAWSSWTGSSAARWCSAAPASSSRSW
ncbi:Sugar symporter [Pseudonocardia sp. Ae150A_Ps1]|nr:Sugar symporter [Pseudonocardia sp. Ae150A_Ps1]